MNKEEIINELKYWLNFEAIQINKIEVINIINLIKDLEQQNLKYKEVIDKAIEYLDDWLFNVGGLGACMDYKDIKEILDILKEVE